MTNPVRSSDPDPITAASGTEPRELIWITLTGVEAFGYHGVFAHEHAAGQTFVVDVTMGIRPPERDDVADTVDYAMVAGLIVEQVQGPRVDLIETLAAAICERLVRIDKVVQATVTVHKPQAPLTQRFADVSVTVTRRAAS